MKAHKHGLIAGLVIIAACSSRPKAEAPAPVQTPPVLEKQPVEPAIPAEPQPGSTTPPTLGEVKPLTLPKVVRTVLPNGLTVLTVEHHELPLADFVLLVKSGSESDPARKEGLASLTANMLDEGTTTRNATDIANQAAYLGVELSTSSGWDASRISLHTPTSQLDSALALFSDVALRPSFAAKELERLRKERLTQLLQIKDRGPQIADQAFAKILYGDDHPYGRPQIGTEPSVKGLTRTDLQNFYKTHYAPNNSVLIVVGDVTPADITARVTKLFGNWKQTDVADVKYPEVAKAGVTTIYLIDKPGAPQSSFRIGAVGVQRNTGDFFPISVMNTVLGGAFTSRLNNNLRETKGYTYGAGSSFSMRESAGPFQARAEIVREKSDSALVEFMKELRNIRDTVPATELEKAKKYLQLQLPSQFETTSDIAQGLVPVALYNLPLEYFNHYAQSISRVTQADVQRIAQQYVNPQNMSIVIVGDRKSIEESLRKLNIGKVEIRDISGRTILQ